MGQSLITNFLGSKYEVRSWLQTTIHEARRDRMTRSLLGRWRNHPHIDHGEWVYRAKSERSAMNFGIQGSAADIVMLAMLRLCRSKRLAEIGFRLVLQIHDEFVLEGPKEHIGEA